MPQNTATQVAMLNFRHQRARAMASALMTEMDDVLPDCDRQAIYHRILGVLHQNGAAWTTDEERAAYGLEPRDDLGWTPSERVEQKRAELEAMLSMQSLFIPKPEDT